MVLTLTTQKRMQAVITAGKGRGKERKGKSKEGAYPQPGFSAWETPEEERYGHAWNQTIGLPAIGLTIPQLQQLGGLARELLLHGWHQCL